MSAPIPIPVICDRCRTAGSAGSAPFTDLGDLLDFAPVPRRPRVGGWSADVQRAFIAALAVTGSARQSAAAVGRAQYGVEQLRRAKGSAGFNAAFDRAMTLAGEKGRHRLAAGVAAVARADAAAGAHLAPAPLVPSVVDGPTPEEEPPIRGPVTEADRERLRAETMHRALHGEEVPIFHAGRKVGTRRVYNHQLALHHLKESAPADGIGKAPGGGALLRGRELRIHHMLLENPYWTRAFAEKLIKYGNSILRKFPRPWLFGKEGDLVEEILFYQQAFHETLKDDPARAAAFETLFGPEGAPEDYPDAQRHAAIIFECFFPGALELVDKLRKKMAVIAAQEERKRLLEARRSPETKAPDAQQPDP